MADKRSPVTGQVVVGVVDTGVVILGGEPHHYIKDNLAEGWKDNEDRLPVSGEALGRYDGHGTFVAGLIKQQAPAVLIDVRRGLDESAGGADRTVAKCIEDLCAVENLKIVNLSFFGTSEEENREPAELRRALDKLFGHHPDVVVVTAAANRWTADKHWPAGFSEDFAQVIAVGAVDETVTPVPGLSPPRASFCSWWDGIDVFAGGCGILGPSVRRTQEPPPSAFPPSLLPWHAVYGNGAGTRKLITEPAETDEFTFSLWSGASFAAAKVTGLLAQAMLDGAHSGKDALAKVINPSLPRIPLPGKPEGKPYLPGIWPAPTSPKEPLAPSPA
nr:S8/S53 family peptidase [Amycolatopsis lexingtonensis]